MEINWTKRLHTRKSEARAITIQMNKGARAALSEQKKTDPPSAMCNDSSAYCYYLHVKNNRNNK